MISNILKEDFDISVSQFTYDFWKQFQNKCFLVTGATGLLGNQICKVLLTASKKHHLDLHVIALGRSKEKILNVFQDFLSYPSFSYFIADVSENFSIPQAVDYIIHGASITSSKDFVDLPVETIRTTLYGTENILKLAHEKKITSMVYLSSMEIYGVVPSEKNTVYETDYGYIDPLSVRSSYSEGKRMAECLCCSYHKELKVPVKIARLTQTFGPGVEYHDNRVFAQFARSIIENTNIVLRTTGATVRNYCYTRDAIAAILLLLSMGVSGEAYNIANPDTTISIKEMAQELINNHHEAQTKLVFDLAENIEQLGYAPTLKMNLNVDKIAHLGWKPTVSLMEMFDRMIWDMKENIL